MQQQYDLNDSNFMIHAMKAYDKPNCIMSEFESDMKRVKYIKRLIKKYHKTSEIKERLILNHIIVLSNVFNVHFTVKMLFYKLDKEDYHILKPFLVYLNYMPDKIETINSQTIMSSDIFMDENIIEILRRI